MRTRDFVRICNKLSKICKLMAEEKNQNLGYKKTLLKYSNDFKRMGKVYAKLNQRKKNGKKIDSLSKRRKRSK